MITLNQKNLGLILICFSIILLVSLSFVKVNSDNQGAFLCELVAENQDTRMENCPVHTTTTSWLIIVAFGISFLILGSGLYLYFMPGKKSGIMEIREDFKEIDFSKLNEEERRIYDILKEKDGSVYQSDLIKETDFTKVKMTRILDRMEQGGIIDRKRRGMTNIIILK